MAITKRKNRRRQRARMVTSRLPWSASEFNDSLTTATASSEKETIALNHSTFNNSSHSLNTITDNTTIYTSKNTVSDLPRSLRGYYASRFSLFHLFNEGIKIDHEGWFSVTPETIASHIAKRCACNVIIDAFCGVGGNAIQFTKTCKKVIAIDIDETRLEIARHNAKVYGVEDRIEFILGNALELLPTLKAEVVFLSPPWGGPNYRQQNVFDIETMVLSGKKIYDTARKVTKNIAYYMPKNVDLDQMASLSPEASEMEFQHLNGRMKACCVYYGDL